ncbi:MAG: hypothetical protein K6F99_06040 [Lachnospiraceae bacterium]|nr:hypothetical protein [Lachnospiraceae bacterium]
MARYDFDSYTLYEMKKQNVYSVKIKVILKDQVNGAVLKTAAEKAFVRFPYYCRTVSVDHNGAYILEHSEKLISVTEGDRSVKLGTEETNGLLFAVTYEGKCIYFNFAHNFCGGCGSMRWIKATLWQYLTDLGHDIDKGDILTTETPITAEEQAEPDIASLPEGEPLGNLNFAMDSFTPRSDYMDFMKDPDRVNGYYAIRIPKSQLMKYAHDNDGSPNSILAVMQYKMGVKALPDESKFTIGIANNYREDVGCPDTYRDIVRIMHVQYNNEMKDWPAEKLSTVTRSRMYVQMQPEISWDKCRKVEEFRRGIDAQPNLDAKADYAAANSPIYHSIPSSFHISYVGKIAWGGLGPFLDGVYSITYGHLMIEVNATEEDFCLSFQTIRKDGKYIKEFLQALDEEGIKYSVGELEDRKLPDIILPDE